MKFKNAHPSCTLHQNISNALCTGHGICTALASIIVFHVSREIGIKFDMTGTIGANDYVCSWSLVKTFSNSHGIFTPTTLGHGAHFLMPKKKNSPPGHWIRDSIVIVTQPMREEVFQYYPDYFVNIYRWALLRSSEAMVKNVVQLYLCILQPVWIELI